jgi:hypothetical protein
MTMKNRLHVSLLALFVIVAGQRSAPAAGKFVDLLEAGADSWRSPDPSRWTFTEEGELRGSTPELNGAKTSPRASSFLLSKQTFGGDIVVTIDITFETGRYLGVYVDYDQQTQSVINILILDPKALIVVSDTVYHRASSRYRAIKL